MSKTGGDALPSLDLLVVTPVFEPVWKDRQRVEWRGRPLDIVSLEGLATMKRLAGRPQDLADLAALHSEGIVVVRFLAGAVLPEPPTTLIDAHRLRLVRR